MALSSTKSTGDVIADINSTPLIDVMLVLLVILIVTLPIQTNAVKIAMPRTGPAEMLPVITVAVDFDGSVLWNGRQVDRATLDANFAGAARQSPQPEIHLIPDRLAKYDAVAKVMSDARRLGATKLTLTGMDPHLR